MRNQFGGHAVKTEAPPGGDVPPQASRCRCTSPTWSCTTSAPTPTPRSRSSRASTAFIGSNGQGKTNLVEAIDYLSRLTSHRVATDAPLVRVGAEQAVVRAAVVKEGRQPCSRSSSTPAGPTGPGSTSRRSPGPATWSGWCARWSSRPRTSPWSRATPPTGAASSTTCWCCAPRGWPASAPTTTGCCKQRNSLLKTAGLARAGPPRDARCPRSVVWDAQLARVGAELLEARLALVDDLRPMSARPTRRWPAAPRGTTPRSSTSALHSRPGRGAAGGRAARRARAPAEGRARPRHLPGRPAPRRAAARSATAGPASRLPVKGYASHGESWSFALALRLASYDLLRADGDDPILILDDVFAELDTERRAQLAELVAGAEQVLVTAAVAERRARGAGRGAVRRGRRGGDAVSTERRTGRCRGDRPDEPGRTGRRPRPGARADPRRRRGRPRRGPEARASGRPAAATRQGLRSAPRRPRPPAPRHHARTAVADQGWELDLRVHGVFARWPELVGAEVGAALHPGVVRRREARGAHRLDGLGDPAEAARADRRTPPQRGARRRTVDRDRGARPAPADAGRRAAVGARRPRSARHLRLSRPGPVQPICGPLGRMGTVRSPAAALALRRSPPCRHSRARFGEALVMQPCRPHGHRVVQRHRRGDPFHVVETSAEGVPVD